VIENKKGKRNNLRIDSQQGRKFTVENAIPEHPGALFSVSGGNHPDVT
jgi:pyruvate/2-oxoglutarate dehydrogenase complex dihydrolipoamide acyltransferase (E2) component